MVEECIIVEEAITTKVGTKIILEEDLDFGYVIKITISTHNLHTKIGLTLNTITLVDLERGLPYNA